jgi:hypothetical protein
MTIIGSSSLKGMNILLHQGGGSDVLGASEGPKMLALYKKTA